MVSSCTVTVRKCKIRHTLLCKRFMGFPINYCFTYLCLCKTLQGKQQQKQHKQQLSQNPFTCHYGVALSRYVMVYRLPSA